MKKLISKINKIGIKKLLAIFFSPFFQLYYNPVSLYKTISENAFLLNGQWSRYSRFNVLRSFNSAWHRMYDRFIERYGRCGYCYEMGLGESLVSKFYYSKYSMKHYTDNEIMTPIIGMFGFIFVLYLSTHHISALNSLIVICMVMISSSFYFATFEALKYDALGWIMTPWVLFSIVAGYDLYLFTAMIIIMILSVSVFVPMMAIVFVASFLNTELFMVFFLLFFIFVFRFKFLLHSLKDLSSILTLIGMNRKGKKLRRLGFTISSVYTILLQLAFIGYYWFISDNGITQELLFVFTTLVLFVANTRFVRFADIQTPTTLFLLTYSWCVISNFDIGLLILFWFIISPNKIMLGFAGEKFEVNHILPHRKAFEITSKNLIVDKFIESIPSYERVFFYAIYNLDRHEKLSEYGSFKEYLAERLFLKHVSLLPDYYLISQHHVGKFDLQMINDINTKVGLKTLLSSIGASFVVLPEQFVSFGILDQSYEKVSELDIKDLYNNDDTGYHHLFPGNKSKIFLFKVSFNTSLLNTGKLNEIKENKILMQADQYGEAGIKVLYDKGWYCSNGANVTSDLHGFIKCNGKPSMQIELIYDYYRSKSE